VRRAATVLLTAALTSAGLTALGSPASATDGVVRDLTITVTGLGPENRTCQLDADLYVPAGVDPGHRAPALLATNGFGGTKKDQADLAQGFGEHGYVTLSYTGIGFVDGDTCPVTLDDREHDGAAAGQLLRFLGGDRSIQAVDDATGKKVVVNEVIREDRTSGTKHDPAVGMTGGSYGGQIQFAAAGFERTQGTDRLDAIIPLITWNDLAYSLAPENSGLPGGTAESGSVTSTQTGVFKYQWAALFTTVGVANGAEDLPSPEDGDNWQKFVTEGCANFDRPVCTALLDVSTQGYPSQASIDFLRSNSVASYIDDIQVPTLIGQGQADTLFNLQESVATYASLKEQGTPVSLVWQSWGHSDSSPVEGELDMRHPAQSYQGRQALAWFEHYVRGTGPAPELNFSYYRDWVFEETGEVEQAYTSAPSFPVATTERNLYLSSEGPEGGSLVDSSGDVATGTSVYTSPSVIGPNYSETSALDRSPPVSDPDGTAIRFTSAPLAAPVAVVGSPRLTVTLDSAAEGTRLLGPDGELVAFAKLYDIAPDGTTVELPQRLISPVRIGDLPGPVTIELPGIVHRFEAGHSFAVVLAGGDMAYRGSNLRQTVSLSTGEGITQQLTLPVVG
jgi:putative CocE/NonD family hydrolase